MNDREAAIARIQSLAADIGHMAMSDLEKHARDISVAAKTIISTVDPSAADGSAELVIRMSPWVPGSDRVELNDGTLIKNVVGVEIVDEVNQRRKAKISVVGPVVLGEDFKRSQ